MLSTLDEYRCVKVLVDFPGFLHHFVLAKLATSSTMVNLLMLKRSSSNCRLDL